MPEIRCPNCGRNNPDLLDVCQFCQTRLRPDSVLHSGDTPTKKNTGELQSILPDWLKDIQQQSKESAEEDAAQAASKRASQKEEPSDLLAGLASQGSNADDEDVPDWLASLNPGAKAKSPEPSASSDASSSDFFAQFDQPKSKPEPVSETSAQEDAPSWIGNLREEATIPFEKDELSEWLNEASGRPEEVVESDEQEGETGWGGTFVLSASAETSSPKEEEDLSWLRNLEATAKQTGDLQTPKQETDWTANFEAPPTPSPSASQDDLSWLDRLGGIEEPSQPSSEQTTAPGDDLSWLDQFGGTVAPSPGTQSSAPQEDLSWLNNFGATSDPQPVDAAPNQPISPPPFATEADLDWLNKLGGVSEPAKPSSPFSVPEEKSSTEEEDLSWLNNLGKPAEPSAPVAPNAALPPSQADLSWLNELGGEPEPLSTPPFEEAEKAPSEQRTPLSAKTMDEAEPDWLKSATETPSMPPPGDLSMDWFSSADQTEKTPPSTPQTSPFEADIVSTPGDPAALSNQDVDSLFSVDLPDWLSRPETETAEPSAQQTSVASSEEEEALAPVDLPSWVQAMRPVEAVIRETTPSVADQPVETEGPLAGLQGVLPIAPAGSPRRPKPVSLTLQASDEQQASAILLEEILGSETSPRALITSPVVTSQQWLRWALTGLFLLVLSGAILLRSQAMPVSAGLPGDVSGLPNAVMAIPATSQVLVVIDYEPSLAGEMEAVAGPLLDQVVLLSQPNLSFISTSPNGAALVQRLITNTGIDQGSQPYLNLGYLPGGSAGVLGFIESPGQIIPAAGVGSFSEYAALLVLTDHAESGRVWVEQLQNRKAVDPALANQPLLMVASAQAGPLLQPYVSSRQINGMVSGLADAARYEFVNNSRPGTARAYWDTFGIGLILSVALITIGSLWSLFTGMRARRANAEQG